FSPAYVKQIFRSWPLDETSACHVLPASRPPVWTKSNSWGPPGLTSPRYLRLPSAHWSVNCPPPIVIVAPAISRHGLPSCSEPVTVHVPSMGPAPISP